jgi:hypothetical protein
MPTISPSATTALSGDAATYWFDRYRQTPFPVSALPPHLAGYVSCQAARFGVDVAITATAALAQLAGVRAENHAVRSLTGAAVPLPFNVIIATPPGPGPGAAIREIQTPFRDLQSRRLQTAAGLERRAVEELRHTPLFRLPDFARPVGDFESRQVVEARLRALRIAQKPVFQIESPGARELRQAFAGSHDQTVLLTYIDGMDQLMANDLPGRRLVDLLARLCRTGQIHSGGKSGAMIEARMGLLVVTNTAALEAAITGDGAVAAVIRHGVLLRVPGVKAPRPPEYAEIRYYGEYWTRLASTVLESRVRLDGLPPHPTFYEPLIDWNRRLQLLTDKTPPDLQSYLAVFDQLPAKIATLFLDLGIYGGPRDRDAAEAAITVTEYLMTQTLAAVSDAHGTAAGVAAADARERMLVKIAEHGPITPWRLRRHFKRQNRAVHQPVLDALLRDRRVRLDPSGRLVAS